MKKTFTVTAFDVYDYTQECSVCSGKRAITSKYTSFKLDKFKKNL